MVGAEFFRLVACGYIAAAFPTHPVLAEYGEGFAAFLAGYPPAQSLPYLADTARLDWALNLAFHAVPVPALTAGDLQALDGEHLTGARLVLQAGAALIESSYPLHRIWAMARPGAAEETVDLQAGGARLLVLRRSDDAAFVPLSAGEAAFVTALAEGGTLEEGAARGLLVDDVFDLSSSLARLLALSTFAALRQD